MPSDDDDKTIGVDKGFRTNLLNRKFGAFKRPNAKATSHLDLAMLRFHLPEGKVIDVPATGTIIIGRGSNNPENVDVDLDIVGGGSSGVSRVHALIQVADDAVFIRDNGSRNGVFLNGEELYPNQNYKLSDSDILLLGSIQMQVFFMM